MQDENVAAHLLTNNTVKCDHLNTSTPIRSRVHMSNTPIRSIASRKRSFAGSMSHVSPALYGSNAAKRKTDATI